MNMPFGYPPGMGGGMPQHSTQSVPQAAPAAPDPTRIVIGPVILSYPKLFVPEIDKQNPTKPPKYAGEFLVYENNPAAQRIIGMLNQATHAAVQQKWPGQQISLARPAYKDLRSKNNYQGPAGIFFRANNKNKPDVRVGQSFSPCDDQSQFYPGAVVWVSVKAAAYDQNGSKGVKLYLNQIVKVADGPRLVPERDPTADFAPYMQQMQFNIGSPTAPAGMQQGFGNQPQIGPVMGMPEIPGMPQMGQMQQPQGYPQQPQMPGYPQQQMPQQMPGYPQQPQVPGMPPQPQGMGMMGQMPHQQMQQPLGSPPQAGYQQPQMSQQMPGYPQQPQMPGMPQQMPQQMPGMPNMPGMGMPQPQMGGMPGMPQMPGMMGQTHQMF